MKKDSVRKEIPVASPMERNNCGDYLILGKLDSAFPSRMDNVPRPLKIANMLMGKEN